MDGERHRPRKGGPGKTRDLAARRAQREAPERGSSPRFRHLEGRRAASRVRPDRHRFGSRGAGLLQANGAAGGQIGHDLGGAGRGGLPQLGVRPVEGAHPERPCGLADPQGLRGGDRREGRDRRGLSEDHGAAAAETSDHRSRRRPSRNGRNGRPRLPGPGSPHGTEHARGERPDTDLQELCPGNGWQARGSGRDTRVERGALYHQRTPFQSRGAATENGRIGCRSCCLGNGTSVFFVGNKSDCRESLFAPFRIQVGRSRGCRDHPNRVGKGRRRVFV
mmetsp:Transcript_7484/g.18081  ORF Transcript_7484/g.18081 Transcript_7484/m.18081 type:complete len:278 (+) Transcript_7484:334-1167(+)